MSFVRKTLSAAILFAALSAGAHASVTGQNFNFANTVGAATLANEMFDVTDGGSTFQVVRNVVGDGTSTTNTVSLKITNFGTTAGDNTTTTITAQYFLRTSSPTTLVTNPGDYNNQDITFLGSPGTSNFSALDPVLVTIVDPSAATNADKVLLQFTISSPIYNSNGLNFAINNLPGGYNFLGGTKYKNTVTNPATTANGGFNFTGPNSDPLNSSARTTGFNFSYGNLNPVPEPASMAALAMGGLALLRRRRRA